MRLFHTGYRPRLIWVMFLFSLPILLIACGSGISEEDLALVTADLEKAQSEAKAAQTEAKEAQSEAKGLEDQILAMSEVKRGVTELSEGTIRRLYIDTPLVGAKGYVVADWEKGEVRLEVQSFPASDTGYEAFLFEIDIPAYMGKMFIDGDKAKGLVAEPPPMGDVAGLISQWQSLGDLQMDENGNGVLEYREGDNLYEKGLNMLFVFEKVTAGQHEGPEDVGKLMVECNGPLTRTKGAEGMEKALTIFP